MVSLYSGLDILNIDISKYSDTKEYCFDTFYLHFNSFRLILLIFQIKFLETEKFTQGTSSFGWTLTLRYRELTVICSYSLTDDR